MPEIEAKFLIRHPGQIDQVLATLDALGYEVVEGPTSLHIDTYLDTPSLAVMRAGWAYRCRQRGRTNTLTLKSLDEPNGPVFIREEIEQTLLDPSSLENGKLPRGPVQQKLDDIVDEQRQLKLFKVKSRRTVFTVSTTGDQAARLELDLDQTRIRAENARNQSSSYVDFTELEVELQSGDASTIEVIAQVLRNRIGLVPARFSKFDRGMRVAGLSDRQGKSLPWPPRLRGQDPALELLQRYVQRQLEQLKNHEAVAGEGLDPEGVHKMRVAIRRIRAVLCALQDGLGVSIDGTLDTRLRWLARHLGKVRDADVCEMQIQEFDTALPEATVRNVTPYREYLRDTTAHAYSDLATLLATKRYSNLLADLERLAVIGPDHETSKQFGALTITECAQRCIRATRRRMVDRGDRITAASSAKQLHKLRIEAKRLRYVLGFFGVVQEKQHKSAIDALERLQELLGTHQDAITARDHLADHAESLQSDAPNRPLRLSLGRLMQIADKRASACREHFPATWSEFKRAIEAR